MRVTLELPDDLVKHFNPNQIVREILEALAIHAYRTEKITQGQVGTILGLPSRWAVDAFLKERNVELHYDEGDLESDRKTLDRLRKQHLNSAL